MNRDSVQYCQVCKRRTVHKSDMWAWVCQVCKTSHSEFPHWP